MKQPLPWFFALCLLAVCGGLVAQCPNPQNTLNISTGFNPLTSTVGQPNTFDPMWRLVQSPVPPPGWNINLGGPAYIIPQSSSWHAAGSSSQYINAFNTNQSVLNNWSLSTLPYIFEREFCICDPGGGSDPSPVAIDFSLHADNWAEVYLEDPAGNLTLLYSQQFQYTTASFLNPADQYSGTYNLTPGTYHLQLHLRNQQVVMGVALDGTLTSSGLISDLGCHPYGAIAGIVRNDCDGDGSVSSGDAMKNGVPVKLYDASNNLVASTFSDQNGFYFFESVPAGTYRVEEILNDPDWQAVLPASGAHAGIVVSEVEMAQLDFLNRHVSWAGGGNTVPCALPLSSPETLEGAPSAIMRLFPNPSDGAFQMTLELFSRQAVVVEVSDLKGAVHHQQELGTLSAGNHQLDLDLHLPAGIYLCRVTVGNDILHQKLQVH
ncbi:MAG: T9SS type A sorting domain-containing protein [Salibacteraceae bacterium]